MRLTIRKSEYIDDWYVIERAEHDGRVWLEPMGSNSARVCTSSRFGDSDPEGPAEEMRAIANAIRTRRYTSHRRCAVRVIGDYVEFWSPRNSQEPGIVFYADALALADEIDAKLGEKGPTT